MRSPFRRAVLTLALAAVPAAVASAPAAAGVWARALCQNPSGSPAPIDGLVFTAQNAGVNGASGGSSCPGGLTGAGPVVSNWLSAGGGVWALITEDSGSATQATWTYSAPPGSTIAGGTITGVEISQLTWGVPLSEFDAFISSPGDAGDPADVVADCDSPAQSTSNGVPGSDPCALDPLAQGTRRLARGGLLGAAGSAAPLLATIASTGGTQLFMTAGCSIQNTDPCLYNPQSLHYLSMTTGFGWADILLRDNNQPTATGFGGSLLAGGEVHGTAHLTLTATDPNGPGVYAVSVKIDATPIPVTSSTNGGECTPVGTDPSSGALIFDYQQPCPTSEQLDVPVDTTKLTDGTHDLQVSVTDAAGNVATVLDQEFQTANLTSVASTTPEGVKTASTTGTPVPTGTGGGSPTPSPPASILAFKFNRATAKLVGKIVRRRYLGSRVVLSGTVVNQAGVPAPGIPISARAASLTGGGLRTVASATTDGAGRFAITVPRGDSRLVQLVVGTASVSFRQHVRPNISLSVRPLHGRRLLFTGRVAIARARLIPVIEIADHTAAGWEPIATIHATRAGRYRYLSTASRLAIGETFYMRASTPATTLWQRASSRVRIVKVIR